MIQNHLHQIVISESDLIDLFYQGVEISDLVVDQSDWIKQFISNCNEFGMQNRITWQVESQATTEEFIMSNRNDWALPPDYNEFDIKAFLLESCVSDAARGRVAQELEEYERRDLIPLLRWIRYFVNTMRANKLVWGVGRGSSCASYCLYLLGLHRIDSIKYDLPISEFLK